MLRVFKFSDDFQSCADVNKLPKVLQRENTYLGTCNVFNAILKYSRQI